MNEANVGSDVIEDFRVTPGFVAFLGLLLLPAFAALAIYIGAALVVNDVTTAEARTATAERQESSFNVAPVAKGDAAGWKRALVGICPLH